jgi:hypothetical protein
MRSSALSLVIRECASGDAMMSHAISRIAASRSPGPFAFWLMMFTPF